MTNVPVLQKFNVTVLGDGEPTLVLAHGFGSDQTAWRHQVADLAADHRVVVFDHLGCGKADLSNFNPRRYSSFARYAEDLLEIYGALGLTRTVFVGHSVSAMIGMVAAAMRPEAFETLVFVGASPRYLDDADYVGGFTPVDLNTLYGVMADDYLGWANGFGPLAMGNPDRPELGREFARSLSSMRPDVAQSIARVIFESDMRDQLPRTTHPVLVCQSRSDPIVPMVVGSYLADHLPNSRLVVLDSTGHIPQLSAPAAVTAAIRTALAS